MSDEPQMEFDDATIQAMNEKAIRNQLFIPDHIYFDLGLMKDIPLGCAFMDYIVLKQDEVGFTKFQADLQAVLPDYQTRVYDTVDPYLTKLGYTDRDIEEILAKPSFHDYIFMMAPVTSFFQLMIHHMILNQNHSKPGEKFNKKKIDKEHYILEPMPVTYYINTFPLTLSPALLEKTAETLGESFGANIRFINRDPALFDEHDWDDWLEKVECFYIDSIGRLSHSPFFIKKQGDMQFSGAYFKVRKRFEKHIQHEVSKDEFDQQIQNASARMGLFCEFQWLQNNDVRLTEEAQDVPMTEDPGDPIMK